MRKSTPLNFHQCQTHHVTITVKWQFEREYSYPTDIELKVKKTEWCFYPAIDDESSLKAEFELFCFDNIPFLWSFSEAKTKKMAYFRLVNSSFFLLRFPPEEFLANKFVLSSFPPEEH